MFQPTARDTMYPITTNRTGYSNTTVLRRNGNAVGTKQIFTTNFLNNPIKQTDFTTAMYFESHITNQFSVFALLLKETEGKYQGEN